MSVETPAEPTFFKKKKKRSTNAGRFATTTGMVYFRFYFAPMFHIIGSIARRLMPVNVGDIVYFHCTRTISGKTPKLLAQSAKLHARAPATVLGNRSSSLYRSSLLQPLNSSRDLLRHVKMEFGKQHREKWQI